MNILALEPYYGGSHKAFLDGWRSHSQHNWTVLSLPPYKWKWRMRHAPVTLAEQVNKQVNHDKKFDILFCSDMLNLAEFKGLVNPIFAHLPSVVYFHENQLTYPVRVESERDYHFAYTNFTTAKAATQVWFNSEFHRSSFLEALDRFLSRMPDYSHHDDVETIGHKSFIYPQGIQDFKIDRNTFSPPVHILWAARWEHDKNPEMFFRVIERLYNNDIDFKLSVIGESFSDVPEIFCKAKDKWSSKIIHWGYRESTDDYYHVLGDADIIVSTADHEFFGISVVEAVTAGAFPLLPDKLAYPEIFNSEENPQYFYDGSEDDLLVKLTSLIEMFHNDTVPFGDLSFIEQFQWTTLGGKLDTAINDVPNIEQF